MNLPEFSPAEAGGTPLGEAENPRGKTVAAPAPCGGGQAETRGCVGFVSGCVMSVLFGQTNANSVRLLNRAGYDVLTPRAQGCCGALYAHAGNLERARDCARRNIELFARHDLDAIIINAAGCGSTLKEYGQLLRGDPDWTERGRAFSAKVKDLTEFLVSSFELQANHRATQSADRSETRHRRRRTCRACPQPCPA